MTLKMTTAQVVETSVTVTNSSFQNYTYPDDHTGQISRCLEGKEAYLHFLISHFVNDKINWQLDFESYNSGTIVLMISNRPRATRSVDLNLTRPQPSHHARQLHVTRGTAGDVSGFELTRPIYP